MSGKMAGGRILCFIGRIEGSSDIGSFGLEDRLKARSAPPAINRHANSTSPGIALLLCNKPVSRTVQRLVN